MFSDTVIARMSTTMKAIILIDLQDTDLTQHNKMSIFLTQKRQLESKVKSVIRDVYQGFLDHFDFNTNNNEPEVPALKQKCADVIKLVNCNPEIDVSQPLPHAHLLKDHEPDWCEQPEGSILVAVDPDGFRFYFLKIAEITDDMFTIHYTN